MPTPSKCSAQPPSKMITEFGVLHSPPLHTVDKEDRYHSTALQKRNESTKEPRRLAGPFAHAKLRL